MMLVFHGGKCCAIRHIHTLYYSPTAIHESVPGPEAGSDIHIPDPDRHGAHIKSNLSFYPYALPKETGIERLDRYLAFLEMHRPGGIVEVTLSDVGETGIGQNKNWSPVLLERGFKEVNTIKNSNTGNIVHVWHLNMVRKPKPKAKTNNRSVF